MPASKTARASTPNMLQFCMRICVSCHIFGHILLAGRQVEICPIARVGAGEGNLLKTWNSPSVLARPLQSWWHTSVSQRLPRVLYGCDATVAPQHNLGKAGSSKVSDEARLVAQQQRQAATSSTPACPPPQLRA